MPRSWSLSAKLGAIGAALLLMAFASIGEPHAVGDLAAGGRRRGKAAVSQRSRPHAHADLAPGAGRAMERADERQKGALFEQFDSSIGVLRTGDPARPLFVPHDHASQYRPLSVVQRIAEWDVLSWKPPGARMQTWPWHRVRSAQFAQQADGRVREPHRQAAFVSAYRYRETLVRPDGDPERRAVRDGGSHHRQCDRLALLRLPVHLQSAVPPAGRALAGGEG